MSRRTGEQLTQLRGIPAVTILCPSTHIAPATRTIPLSPTELRDRARVVDDALEPAQDNDPGAIDAVEEVVRHGGDVLVVPADSLADVGRIALVTRY